MLLKALNFAAQKHKNQKRKGGKETSPYINHLIEVAYLIEDTGRYKDEATLCAAVLHDTVEDVGVTFEELKENFNEEIANLVIECTDDKTLPKSERKKFQVEHTKTISFKAQNIKIADKISNISGITTLNKPQSWDDIRVISYLEWTKEVVDTVKNCNEGLYKLFLKTYEIEMKNIFPNFKNELEKLKEIVQYQYSEIDKEN